ncbi:MAG: hypothetical protein Q9160_003278 [Pyrenula sp. 1 TL-2023]
MPAQYDGHGIPFILIDSSLYTQGIEINIIIAFAPILVRLLRSFISMDGRLPPSLISRSSSSSFDAGSRQSSRESSADVFSQEVDNFLSFTGAEKPKPNSIFILVMGMTGSGKSTFISRRAGKHVQIGHDLQSCTANLSIISFLHPDNVHTVYLLDTPGFDDTNLSDIDILAHIAHYLSISYANRICISGIIFLHSISDNRVSGSKRRNITMFREVVGEAAYENVAIATTMWRKGEYDAGARRENQLCQDYFNDILAGGGRMSRLASGVGGSAEEEDKARLEALEIVSHLMARAKAGPVVLKIQSEIVDERKTLDQTAAGRVLGGEFQAQGEEIVEQLQETSQDLQSVLHHGDEAAAQSLQEVKSDLERKDQLNELNQAELNKTLQEMYSNEEERLHKRIEEMESRWQESVRQKEQELRAQEESLRDQMAAAELEAARWKQQQAEAAQLQAAMQESDARRRFEMERQRQRERERFRQAEEIAKRREWEVLQMRKEFAALRGNIEKKQRATEKVREGFRSSIKGGVARGLTSGAIAVGKEYPFPLTEAAMC